MSSVTLLMGSWMAPSETFIYRHMKMLQEIGALESIISARLDRDTTWKGVPVYGLNTHGEPGADGTPHLPSQLKGLETALARSKADIILCEYGTIATLLKSVLRRAPKRLYIHVHGKDTEEHMHPPGYREDFENLAQGATVFCSPVPYTRLRKWRIPSSNLVEKNYGVEVPEAPMDHSPDKPLSILHIGRLIDCKSPDRTIEAFDLACELGLEGRLVMIGDGPLRTMCELLRARSKWRDRIEILGSVADETVRHHREEAGLFTLHSIRGELSGQVEAFGVSVVEAMGAALPVVSCAVGGIQHIVVDGVTGILVEPGDVEAQAQAFLRLAADPALRRQMGLSGWARARDHYSYEMEKEALLLTLGLSWDR